jgi:hypothetical protein
MWFHLYMIFNSYDVGQVGASSKQVGGARYVDRWVITS